MPLTYPFGKRELPNPGPISLRPKRKSGSHSYPQQGGAGQGAGIARFDSNSIKFDSINYKFDQKAA